MSGGERKVKRPRAQGWEEAGGEFYQESYPGCEADLDSMHQNPSNIATLLPSKQNRTATYSKKYDTKGTLRRRTASRSQCHNTIRRPSMAPVSQAATDLGALLPDLSENLSNEERTWEEIMQIKAMPVSMAQKKEHKAKLQSQTKLRLQGIEQLKWQRRKMWQQLKKSWSETLAKMDIWRLSMKEVEGDFGTGVVAYFLFIKWLMLLNLGICLLMVVFIVLPALLLKPAEQPQECNLSSNVSGSGSIECCSAKYANSSSEAENIVIQIVQGRGIVEHTQAFYGIYPNVVLDLNSSAGLYYDMPLAYISVALTFMLISLAAIVKSAAKGFKERLVEGEGQFYQYCNIIFSSWDFCINNEKSANIKHKAIYYEIKSSLESERIEEERITRSKEERFKLFSVRILVNVAVIVLITGALYLIYAVFDFSARTQNEDFIAKNELLRLLFEFLPSLCVVGLNLIIPIVLGMMVSLERYSPVLVIRMTLMRTVLLRLSSLGVVLLSFYRLFKCDPCKSEGPDENCKAPACWETHVGQQFYKLMLVDFLSHIAVTFIVNLPRGQLAKYSRNSVITYLCEQQFDLPKHVLDVVYIQTLCWLGSFFAPVLPLLAFVIFFFMFYIKKFACLVNSKPSTIPYRASRSNSLFMAVLLLSFVVMILPLGYTIAEWQPSRSCGPFRGQTTVWSVIVRTFLSSPLWLQHIVFFFSTAGFAVPAFVTLVLCLYYFYAVSAANKHMVIVLKNQLVLEGRDKQFLLHRLSTIIKQQQEHHKAMRAAAQSVQMNSTDISSST
ncbi:hypothetical protein FOCC_FOCC011814 [Frankliniella occidentalis]|uniref:Transmembrane channel-like protein 7 n=1 Tax=Frankliniella occidentalis TaxID=133901 RepID=A0A6J1SJV1_FRAOC|nr:transmembrane channel-like protein 7 [Frankliniella occidentalis]XP_052127328.1 transmembrane channel-like protein 7 [Frankliniella occidentalis]KAE8742635.1 hypothetical protein FOCC_FOCC011814 [Frankliniella occidentalis]